MQRGQLELWRGWRTCFLKTEYCERCCSSIWFLLVSDCSRPVLPKQIQTVRRRRMMRLRAIHPQLCSLCLTCLSHWRLKMRMIQKVPARRGRILALTRDQTARSEVCAMLTSTHSLQLETQLGHSEVQSVGSTCSRGSGGLSSRYS